MRRIFSERERLPGHALLSAAHCGQALNCACAAFYAGTYTYVPHFVLVSFFFL